MTPAEAEALGRRLKVAMGHRGRPGMLARHDITGREHRLIGSTVMSKGWWFDLRDPATRGAALEVVRERWGAPELQISPRLRFDRSIMDKGVLVGWVYYVNDLDEHFGDAASEAEALVAALEAAPEANR